MSFSEFENDTLNQAELNETRGSGEPVSLT
jgi:hypothetical protein